MISNRSEATLPRLTAGCKVNIILETPNGIRKGRDEQFTRECAQVRVHACSPFSLNFFPNELPILVRETIGKTPFSEEIQESTKPSSECHPTIPSLLLPFPFPLNNFRFFSLSLQSAFQFSLTLLLHYRSHLNI